MTIYADTLKCNRDVLSHFQNAPQYAYDKQFMNNNDSLLNMLAKRFNHFIERLFNWGPSHDTLVIWSEIIFAVLIIVIIVYLIRKSQKISISKSLNLTYSVEGETIYGINFASGIEEAVSALNYREAIRLVYLQTLKMLSDAKCIEWKLYKTPKQYTAEFGDKSFKTMTRNYVRIRYGNFAATEETFNAIREIQTTIRTNIKKGASE
jgi:hypothetical protein